MPPIIHRMALLKIIARMIKTTPRVITVFLSTLEYSSASRLYPPRPQQALQETGATGLEPAASGVTGRRSNQLSYAPGTNDFGAAAVPLYEPGEPARLILGIA